MKLSCHDQSKRVSFVTKTRQDNNMTDRIGAMYTENNTKLLWLIGSSSNCDENQIG